MSGLGGYLDQDAHGAFQMVIDLDGGKLGDHEVALVVEDAGQNPGNGRQVTNKFANGEALQSSPG